MNQLCKVCGEPAAGFHFGAFTCEGCKSFFGRTYNNLSQIHECKNGGSCVINKQNRTSCKACRLRKCLIVGMSKSGSRYGRRSNWFKIHCLLQEQAQYTSQTPPFRTPVTPTLQDGSLPFVAATHLRDPISGLEIAINPRGEISPSSSHIPLTSTSNTSGVAGVNELPRLITSFPSNFHSPNRMMAGGGRLHDGLVGGPCPSPLSPSLDGSYREHLLNLIHRTHGMGPLLDNSELESFEDARRASPDIENRLGPMAFLEWKRRLREAAKRSEVDVLLERKTASCSPVKTSIESLVETKNTTCRGQLEESKERTVESEEGLESSSKTTTLKNGLDVEVLASSDSKSTDISGFEKALSRVSKPSDLLSPASDHYNFLKSPRGQLNKLRYNNLNNSLRFPGRDDIVYNPVNNNIFSFPPYPPLWPSMIPLSPFSKLYSPYCPPRPQTALNLEGFKASPSFPLLDVPDCRPPLFDRSKEDPAVKKRNLDVILQYQRENGSPCSSPLQPCVSSLGLTEPMKIQTTPVHTPTTTSASTSEQPIDLTVRRKRKMDKSEIIYKPGDDLEMESDVEKDAKEEKVVTSEQMEIKVSEIEVPTTINTKFEVPIKVIKLETTNEALSV